MCLLELYHEKITYSNVITPCGKAAITKRKNFDWLESLGIENSDI